MDRAAFFSRLIALLELTAGSCIPAETWKTRSWAKFGARTIQPVNALALRHNFGETVPGHGNALAVDGMLLLRPIEWGLASVPVKVDFKNEIIQCAGQLQVGFNSHLGAADFNAAAVGRVTPYVWTAHAIQAALRVVASALQAVAPLLINEAIFGALMGGQTVSVQTRLLMEAAPLMGNTGLLPPNSIRTFRHRDVTVCSPAPLHPQLVAIAVHVWRATEGVPPIYAPLPLQPPPAHIGKVDNFMATTDYDRQRHAKASKTVE